MINKYMTCYGCPDRAVGCRTDCKGWQAREAEKADRYQAHALCLAGHYSGDPGNYKRALERKRSAIKRGYTIDRVY